jgi:hypothetical protein
VNGSAPSHYQSTNRESEILHHHHLSSKNLNGTTIEDHIASVLISGFQDPMPQDAQRHLLGIREDNSTTISSTTKQSGSHSVEWTHTHSQPIIVSFNFIPYCFN